MFSKKKLKGMTLMEVVLSIGIYGMIALLIAEIMSLVNATMQGTAQLNRRMNYEAKFADNHITNLDDGSKLTAKAGNTRVSFEITPPSRPSKTITASGTEYVCSDRTLNLETKRDLTIENKKISDGTHYRFIVFTSATRPTVHPEAKFDVTLTLTAPLSKPIRKIVVEGNHYKQGETDFDYQNKVIYSTAFTVDGNSHDTGIDEEFALSTLSSTDSSATRLFTISVPSEYYYGTLRVKLFNDVTDSQGNVYKFDNADDRKTFHDKAAGMFGIQCDSGNFPAFKMAVLRYYTMSANAAGEIKQYYKEVEYNFDGTNFATAKSKA